MAERGPNEMRAIKQPQEITSGIFGPTRPVEEAVVMDESLIVKLR
ncbi:hypothetical protein ROS1_38140 [Roseibium sp. ROS1]|jgi:hypothetical protein